MKNLHRQEKSSNKRDQQQQQPPKKQLNKYARFSGIAFQMIAIIGLGTFAGIKLDQRYPNENNWYTIILLMVSVAISMVYVIKQVAKVSNKKEGDE